jgi:6-pyruvoyltetrahydropterin/6-carboxytetrahydropterin synthase
MAAAPIVEIRKSFSFQAAHRLPSVPAGHKCARLHGHSYVAEIEVTGAIDPDLGWFRDFAALTDAFRPLADELDHHYLNEVPGLENPTSENLAVWIWRRLAPVLPGLSAVTIRETPTSASTYRGDRP